MIISLFPGVKLKILKVPSRRIKYLDIYYFVHNENLKDLFRPINIVCGQENLKL